MSGIFINSNISALKIQRQLASSSSSLGLSYERLSSGSRINRASDDAAGLAIAMALNSSARVFSQGLRNISDGQSLLGIADSALGELSGIAIRIKELAEQSANGPYTISQRRSMDTEANALVKEFNRIVGSVDFNGVKVLDGSLDAVRIQAGFGLDGGIALSVGNELERNQFNGSFQDVVNVATTSTLGYVSAFSDFDNDGNKDLVIIDVFTNQFSIMLGNGDGTFASEITVATAGFTSDTTAGDFNSDGNNDLVMNVAGNLTFFAGNGNGTFAAGVNLGLTNLGLTSGDVNGDGKLDLVGTRDPDTIQVLLGNGNGTFQPRQTYVTANSYPDRPYLADFNNDGRLDLFYRNSRGAGTSDDETVFRLGNGDGSFGASTILATGSNNDAFGDFNEDGNLDLVSAFDNGYFIRFGNGDGTFRTGITTSTAFALSGVLVADMNQDGHSDLVAGNATSGHVLLGNGDGTFSEAASFVNSSVLLSSVDLNGDGVSDLVGSDLSNSFQVLIANTKETTTVARVNLFTQSDARKTLESMTNLLEQLARERGSIGSIQSRLQVAYSNLQTQRENYLASASRISDVDIAHEAANLTRNKILQQVGASVLAQANLAPQLAVTLLS